MPRGFLVRILAHMALPILAYAAGAPAVLAEPGASKAGANPCDGVKELELRFPGQVRLQIRCDASQADIVTAYSECLHRIYDCNDAGKEMDKCVATAPICKTASPWVGEVGCCYAACKTQYAACRREGMTPHEAESQVFGVDGSCMLGKESGRNPDRSVAGELGTCDGSFSSEAGRRECTRLNRGIRQPVRAIRACATVFGAQEGDVLKCMGTLSGPVDLSRVVEACSKAEATRASQLECLQAAAGTFDASGVVRSCARIFGERSVRTQCVRRFAHGSMEVAAKLLRCGAMRSQTDQQRCVSLLSKE